MPSISDSIFLFVLALLLFGPKKLPVLARELGKWVGEFRRASNDFKMQMEDELRASEQSERRKQIDAMEAAAPVAPPLPEATATEADDQAAHASLAASFEKTEPGASDAPADEMLPMDARPAKPLPIATSGEMTIMPPATGLPVSRSQSQHNGSSDPLGALIEAVPEKTEETVTHGD